MFDRLEALASDDDRGALSALRRSLDDEAASFARAAPIVAPFVPHGTSGRDERAAYLVAGLFALHPSAGEDAKRSFGATLRDVALRKDSASLEQRFVALLSASAEDLPHHLRHAVSLARGEDVPIAWRTLLRHVLQWSHPDGWVQRQWARDYWAGRAEAEPEVPSTTNEI